LPPNNGVLPLVGELLTDGVYELEFVEVQDRLAGARISRRLDVYAAGPCALDRPHRHDDPGGVARETLWYYRTLVETFERLDVPSALRREFEVAVDAMEALA